MKLNEDLKQLKRHIELVHSKNEHNNYKTILVTAPHLYIVVTRVNYSTAKLWIEWRNSIVKENAKYESPIKRKITWLTMNRQWRLEQSKEINSPKLKQLL